MEENTHSSLKTLCKPAQIRNPSLPLSLYLKIPVSSFPENIWKSHCLFQQLLNISTSTQSEKLQICKHLRVQTTQKIRKHRLAGVFIKSTVHKDKQVNLVRALKFLRWLLLFSWVFPIKLIWSNYENSYLNKAPPS